MPDPFWLATAASVAGLVAATSTALAVGRGLSSHPRWADMGSVLGIALGFAAGCALLKIAPDWPPREDQDRLLVLILPVVLVVELAAAAGMPAGLAWIVRMALALAVPRVLLHGTVYLETPSGDGLAWSPALRWAALSVLGASLAAVWSALAYFSQRESPRVLPVALGVTCCAAGLTVMLSGYASGGQLGPILGGALLGNVVGGLLRGRAAPAVGAIGFTTVGFFSLLVVGHYFGELAAGHAGVLFLTPWLAVLPLRRWLPARLPTSAVAGVTMLLVLIPLATIIYDAAQRFAQDSAPPGTTGDGAASDYESYGS